ncbi:hypothetical protein AFUB_044410 [Aspergillus fumigatus A1163]|uniref:Uncharacterized protein n=1 Tax=Aspergillus fumigatus (strain CBS 144.89 / FGSC A1163 / CEA10) TaxID=451804 RepID=B0XZL0_ASPFC|nr:hypothetical protein AFUB_044410 [Aspergillus fumigatus A1163]
MDCLASLVPLRIRQWISSFSGGLQKQEVSNVFTPYIVYCTESNQLIIFADAEKGTDDLVVKFLRNRLPDRCSWSEYKSMGPEATAAVVKAGWSCIALDRVAISLREGGFDERTLDQLRQQARNNRRRISYACLKEPKDNLEGPAQNATYSGMSFLL